MNPVWIAGNAIAVVTALICTSYLRYERKGVAKGFTGFQFVYPELVTLFQRDSAVMFLPMCEGVLIGAAPAARLPAMQWHARVAK